MAVGVEDIDDPVEWRSKRCERNKDTSLEVLCLEDSVAGILRRDIRVGEGTNVTEIPVKHIDPVIAQRGAVAAIASVENVSAVTILA